MPEYMLKTFYSNDRATQDELNALVEEGWVVHTFTRNAPGGITTVLLERDRDE